MQKLLELGKALLILTDEHGLIPDVLFFLVILLNEIPATAAALDFDFFHVAFPLGIRI